MFLSIFIPWSVFIHSTVVTNSALARTGSGVGKGVGDGWSSSSFSLFSALPFYIAATE